MPIGGVPITTDLKQPIPGGVRTTHFFNGRLLSAEDLAAEQATRQSQRLQLTRALGDGIAFGLEVSEHPDSVLARPVVTVEPGLAIAPSGAPLELTKRTDLILLRPSERNRSAAGGSGGLFADCAPRAVGAYSAGRAVYVLVASPAEVQEGRAPAAAGSTTSCGPLAVVEGISFRLVWLVLPDGELLDSARLRNRVAHRLLGTDDLRLSSFWSNPRGPVPRTYGLLDALRPDCLGADDVPLAVVGWRTATSSTDARALRGPGIQFVDVWPVRRGLAHDEPAQRWPLLTGRRRRVETEAAFFQFADEIADLTATAGSSLPTETADSRFVYLPAVGILPLARPEAPPGFDPRRFFGPQALPELATLDADLLPSLVHEGVFHEPLKVRSAETIQLYVVWENVTGKPLPTGRPPEPVLVFAKSTIPYRGTARFDWATWSHSRYARVPL